MARKLKNGEKLVGAARWLSKVLIGLGIGAFAISGGLVIPSIPAGFMVFAGWVAVIGTGIDAINDVMIATKYMK